MSDGGFSQDEGYFPAFGEIEGPEGPPGDKGDKGDKGETGALGGAPEWEGVYDLPDTLLTSDALAAAPRYAKTFTVGNGNGGTATWAFIEIPTPGPAPVNPGLNPGDPGYNDVMPPYFAALAAWEARRPLHYIDDVEFGLWIEAEAGQTTAVELGLRGPDGGVYLGAYSLAAGDIPVEVLDDPEDPDGPTHPSTYDLRDRALRIGFDAIDEHGAVREHRLAWWTDQGGDYYQTGKMRRFNRVDQKHDTENGGFLDAFSPAGWAGPNREITYQVANQMKDLFARASWAGIWDASTEAALGDKWCLAIRTDGPLAVEAGKVRIRAARLKLQRYRRRLRSVKAGFRRFKPIYSPGGGGLLSVGIGPDSVRGYANYLHGGAPGRTRDLPVTIPAYNPATHPTPANAARWANWDGVGAGADPNGQVGVDAFGKPSSSVAPAYYWYYRLPRPVIALVEAGASWSRMVPRTDGTLIDNAPDIGSSLVLELWIGQGDLPPNLILDRDIIVIERATQRLDHQLGPKLVLVQSVALLAYNYTTQARDLRGLDDDQFWRQAVGVEGETTTGTPYVPPAITHARAPFVQLQELPGVEYFPGPFDLNDVVDGDDSGYRYELGVDARPYTGLR